MTTLTPELQEAYAIAIDVLFDGVVAASPGDITQGVVDAVDTMMKEIANCSANIAGLLSEMLSILYEITIGAAVGSIITKYRDDIFGNYAADQVNDAIEGLLQEWLAQLLKNKQYVGCLYTARANWRSVITLELMGI